MHDVLDTASNDDPQEVQGSSSKRGRFSEPPSVLSDSSFDNNLLGQILLSLELVDTGVKDLRAALAEHLRRGKAVRAPK